jgi:glycosyltransferase involved in cell wall biosynthesis
MAAGQQAQYGSLSIVVPCYNEQDVLPLFYEELAATLRETQGMDYEVIFVDDGSKDATLSVLRQLAEADPNVYYLSFSRNFGKEAALYAGLSKARGDLVAVMDADLQDPPQTLLEMLRIIQSPDVDSVATRRVSRDGEPAIRSFFARMFYFCFNKLVDIELADGARDFRLMTRKFCDAVLTLAEYNRFTKGLFSWVGFNTVWIPFKNVERAAGQTKWSFFGLLAYAIDGLVAFSTKPLAATFASGVISCFIAFVAIIFLVVRQLLFGDPVAGWASTACIIVFFGGLQLLGIGILGEYLAKTYLEAKKRPIFIERESKLP